jgi:chemotaxis receptor (MCP) glutamine deamidase CheD
VKLEFVPAPFHRLGQSEPVENTDLQRAISSISRLMVLWMAFTSGSVSNSAELAFKLARGAGSMGFPFRQRRGVHERNAREIQSALKEAGVEIHTVGVGQNSGQVDEALLTGR